jgi:hypothetical protein
MGQDPDTRGPITDTLTNEATDMAGGSDCQDMSADCKSWAMHGECARNVDYMVSPRRSIARLRSGVRSAKHFFSRAHPIEGRCGSGGVLLGLPLRQNSCMPQVNKAPLSTVYAAAQVGGNGYDGQCKFSCGKCKPVNQEALDAGVPSADGMAEFEQKLMRQTPANPARPLRWPQKRTSAGRMCIGMSVNACSRGLYTPPSAPEVLDPADRTLQKGVGGPTGCTEAWATLINSDDQVRLS